ncbi:sigma-54 interaction domain-containing protein [Alicyclobacillus kakegawensis]|uniref:sigma-54 interaction domain-containing protein n=1 Tax=Alicyclobacillus kakegawensis TaxID=392012 RepID=UPI00082BB87F|nr:sigma 54-interacting transcriptional regulator [Alicyclobacillus kakegawensis]
MGEQFKRPIHETEIINLVLNALPFSGCLLSPTGELLFANESGRRVYEEVRSSFLSSQYWMDLLQSKTIVGHTFSVGDSKYVLSGAPVRLAGELFGIMAVFGDYSVYRSVFHDELQSYQTTIHDLQTIFDNSYDVLYVSDGEGRTLRASNACEILWGKKPEELVGRTVYELEREGVYRPSATRLALERGEKVQVIQQTKTGRRLMVVSTPIRDVHGKITRVVNASRDITEIHELEEELKQMKALIEGYRQQLYEAQNKERNRQHKLVFHSKVMSDLSSTLVKVAMVDSTVLITGESGVGKEVIANFIHQYSPRSSNPFIKVNCAAIPESLLESELFGYEQGTFTGANRHGKAGLFELAHKGTLFLDEIGDMPLSLQAKLLRVLQDGEVRRIGGSSPRLIDVRIIAATNQNLERRIQEGLFRKDLYYRLNVIPISIPPLRDRVEDIFPLVQHFSDLYSRQFHKRITISNEVIQVFERYNWPGNVRELQNVIERMIVTTEDSEIQPRHIPSYILSGASAHSSTSIDTHSSGDDITVRNIVPLKRAVQIVESELLKIAVQKCSTLQQVARLLEVDPSTISRKLSKYQSMGIVQLPDSE